MTITGAVAVAWAWTAVAAAAQPGGPPRETSVVTVLGIRATTEGKEHIDPPLVPIADELRRSKYNSFRVVARDSRGIPLGETAELPLVEEYALRIQPEKAAEDNIQLTLSWVQYVKDSSGRRQASVLQRMTLVIRRGKYFLSGGWKLREGALLGAVATQ